MTTTTPNTSYITLDQHLEIFFNKLEEAGLIKARLIKERSWMSIWTVEGLQLWNLPRVVKSHNKTNNTS